MIDVQKTAMLNDFDHILAVTMSQAPSVVALNLFIIAIISTFCLALFCLHKRKIFNRGEMDSFMIWLSQFRF